MAERARVGARAAGGFGSIVSAAMEGSAIKALLAKRESKALARAGSAALGSAAVAPAPAERRAGGLNLAAGGLAGGRGGLKGSAVARLAARKGGV
jgi:hypothetical protein